MQLFHRLWLRAVEEVEQHFDVHRAHGVVVGLGRAAHEAVVFDEVVDDEFLEGVLGQWVPAYLADRVFAALLIARFMLFDHGYASWFTRRLPVTYS